MTQHTPGPWTVEDAGEGEWPWLIDAPLCTVAGVSGIGGAEARANANLLSAAPDLLEAALLDKKAEEFDCPHDAEHRCNCGTVQLQLVADARAARERGLAKAESR